MAISTSVGSPGTVASASGGKVTPINGLTTTPIQVVGGNPQRITVVFHNPGVINVYVAPTITGTGAALVVGAGLLGGSFEVFPGGLLTITGECQTAWQAFAASGTTAALTVMESNV